MAEAMLSMRTNEKIIRNKADGSSRTLCEKRDKGSSPCRFFLWNIRGFPKQNGKFRIREKRRKEIQKMRDTMTIIGALMTIVGFSIVTVNEILNDRR